MRTDATLWSNADYHLNTLRGQSAPSLRSAFNL
jgi:hypothetical protein